MPVALHACILAKTCPTSEYFGRLVQAISNFMLCDSYCKIQAVTAVWECSLLSWFHTQLLPCSFHFDWHEFFRNMLYFLFLLQNHMLLRRKYGGLKEPAGESRCTCMMQTTATLPYNSTFTHEPTKHMKKVEHENSIDATLEYIPWTVCHDTDDDWETAELLFIPHNFNARISPGTL